MSKDGKAKTIKRFMAARESKDLNRVTNGGYGYLWK
jgi:hypothetical protein